MPTTARWFSSLPVGCPSVLGCSRSGPIPTPQTAHLLYYFTKQTFNKAPVIENPNMPRVLCLEDAVDELQRGGQVLLERRLDLLGRQDEPAGLRRVGP